MSNIALRFFLLAIIFSVSCPLAAQGAGAIEIENPWSRATTPGAKIAAGYMVIRNKSSAPDRLIGASSPLAARVETHVTVKDGDIMRMRPVKGYDIPANGAFEVKPGGAHLMLIDIKQPFKEGDKIPATLRFAKAGEVKVEFLVSGLGGPPPHQH
jgi:periplasmic copper chaperone A